MGQTGCKQLPIMTSEDDPQNSCVVFLDNVRKCCYMLCWGQVQGWMIPSPNCETKSLSDGSSITFTGTYNPLPGTIVVHSNPDALNAPWGLTGPDDYSNSGSVDRTIHDLVSGVYTVIWGEVTGWTKPYAQTQTLPPGGLITFAGTYLFDSDLDGVADDGDGSGIVGDHPCTGGETENCDDNCPNKHNPDQADSDGDGIGDACENLCKGDFDGDGDVDGVDLAVITGELWQSDCSGGCYGNLDGDDDVDNDDLAIFAIDYGRAACFSELADTDGDGVLDDGDFSGMAGDNPCAGGETESCDDNCLNISNADQADLDGDGIGNACEDYTDIGEGWPYQRMDLSGTNYYPYPTTYLTSNTLQKQFSVPGVTGAVLTGDVIGDGLLEIINVSGDQLTIFDSNGTVLQNVTLGSTNCCLSMIEDVNADGINDIGIGSNGSSMKTYFYDGNGNLIQTLSKIAGYDCLMRPVGLLENGDYIISLSAGYSHADTHRGFAVYDRTTGAEKWHYKVGPCFHITSIADFDSDGKFEFTSSASTCHNGCNADGYDHNGTMTTDGDMWLIVVDEDGNEEFSVKYPSPSDGSTQHYFIDLDHDGIFEILANEGHSSYYPGTSQLHIYDRSGNISYSFDGTYKSSIYFAVADINKDGVDEIIASNDGTTLYILDNTLSVLNSVSINGYVQLVSDINGDGGLEIILLDQSGILTVLDSELSVLDVFDVGDWGSVIASDIDQDGKVELICRTDGLYVIDMGELVIGNVKSTCPLKCPIKERQKKVTIQTPVISNECEKS